MYSPPQQTSRSPPPLQHPIPTHPPRHVPDPPVTPTLQAGSSGTAENHVSSARSRTGGSGAGAGTGSRLGAVPVNNAPYARYSSPPIQDPQQSQQEQHYPQSQQGMHAASSPYDNYGGQSFGSAMAGGGGFSQEGWQGASYGAPGASSSGAGSGYYARGGGAGPSQGGPMPDGQGFGAQFGNFLGNDPNVNMTAQMGMHFGQQMASVGGKYVQKNLGGYLPTMATLRPLFNVSNSYVLHKLRVILFPWRHRPWSRAHRAPGQGGVAVGGVPPRGSQAIGAGESEWAGQGGKARQIIMEGYAPPREDVNAPDLYIPVMSFVTYVLLISVSLGFSQRFRPEILGLTSSRALVIVGAELALIRLCTYLLNVQGDHYGILDLISYSGYKFVPACVTLGIGVLGWGGLLWWSAFFYSYAALAFFLLRSLRHIILPDAASTPSSSSAPAVATITHGQRSRRVQLLFVVAVLQFGLGAGLTLRVA